MDQSVSNGWRHSLWVQINLIQHIKGKPCQKTLLSKTLTAIVRKEREAMAMAMMTRAVRSAETVKTKLDKAEETIKIHEATVRSQPLSCSMVVTQSY